MPRSMHSWIARALLLSCTGVGNAADAPSATASVFDASQLPTVHGAVAHYTLLPRGVVDGFILRDSTQILAVPIFSQELLAMIRPGDAVTVYGLKATGMPLVMALAVTNDRTRQSVLLGEIPLMLAMGRAPSHHAPPANHEPAPSEEVTPASAPRPATINGTVEQPIYGPQGTLSGALLRDGVVLRMASTESLRVAPLFKAGTLLWAKGQLSESPLGKLMMVEAIGSSSDHLMVLAPWDGPQ